MRRYTDGGGVLLVVAAALMWGSWSLFFRYSGVGASVASPVVFLGMGLFGLPFVWRDRRHIVWDRRLVLLLVANAAGSAGNVVTYFGAMSYAPVAIAVLVHYMAPVLVALVAPYVEGQRVPGARAAAAVACVGLVLVLEPWNAALQWSKLATGVGLGALSATFFAATVLVSRRLEPRIGAARVTAFHALLAVPMLLPLAGRDLATLTPTSIALLGAGALLPGAVAGMLFIAGLGRIGSARAAILAYLEPLTAGVVGWLAFDELLGPWAIGGALLIVAAGLYVARASRSRPAATSS